MTEGASPQCPGEGTDPRYFRTVVCGLQNAMSFKCDTEPLGIMLAFPPFIAINCPLPAVLGRRLSVIKGKPAGRWYLMLRAGWRYDKNWKGYIFPEAALKVMQSTVYY